MYICICYGITDTEIKQTITSGAYSRQEIAKLTGAGTCCGRCGEELERLLSEEQKKATPTIYPARAALHHHQPAA